MCVNSQENVEFGLPVRPLPFKFAPGGLSGRPSGQEGLPNTLVILGKKPLFKFL